MVQVALPRFGNGIESVFGGSGIKPINVMGRLEMVAKNTVASSEEVKRKVVSNNAIAARAAVERPSLLSVSA